MKERKENALIGPAKSLIIQNYNADLDAHNKYQFRSISLKDQQLILYSFHSTLFIQITRKVSSSRNIKKKKRKENLTLLFLQSRLSYFSTRNKNYFIVEIRNKLRKEDFEIIKMISIRILQIFFHLVTLWQIKECYEGY